MADSPFEQLHHICIAVPDIDRAVAFYESVGIGPWHDYPPLEEFTDLRVRSAEGFHELVYRWAMIGDSWGWVPGTFEPYPVYAPALVGFLGGPGVGLYVSGAVGPQVGWFPLAPGEAYWPSYSADAIMFKSCAT